MDRCCWRKRPHLSHKRVPSAVLENEMWKRTWSLEFLGELHCRIVTAFELQIILAICWLEAGVILSLYLLPDASFAYDVETLSWSPYGSLVPLLQQIFLPISITKLSVAIICYVFVIIRIWPREVRFSEFHVILFSINVALYQALLWLISKGKRKISLLKYDVEDHKSLRMYDRNEHFLRALDTKNIGKLFSFHYDNKYKGNS